MDPERQEWEQLCHIYKRLKAVILQLGSLKLAAILAMLLVNDSPLHFTRWPKNKLAVFPSKRVDSYIGNHVYMWTDLQ